MTNEIQVNGRRIETDEEGFLVNTDDWNHQVAEHIAGLEEIELSGDALWVVEWVRHYFEENQTVPETRTLLKNMQQNLGEERGTRKYLHTLFPYGYGQQACKIAGMRKPRKLMLDV